MRASVIAGDEFAVATPEFTLALDEGGYLGSSATFSGRNFDRHPDGQPSVVVKDPSAEGSLSQGLSVRLVTNWFEELLEREGN